MPQIQPAALVKAENTFRAHLKNNKQVVIRLAKENGMLKNAKFSNFDLAKGEQLSSYYSLGNHSVKENATKIRITNEISNICEKAMEGAKLFADIMGWIK